jgi:DNA-binding NarL/FixJ family response regulator
VRVVIGEDEALQREGLALQLTRGGFAVVGAAANPDELVRLTYEQSPDVVITDIRMPPGHDEDGLQAAVRIRRARPGTAIVVLSHYLHRSYALALLATGSAGVGYLLKQRILDAETFCGDVRRVAAGASVLDPEVITIMLARARRRDPGLERLTTRQTEILALMAEGRSNAAIARQLVVTEKAVVRHVSHIYDTLTLPPNLDDHRRVMAVVRYLTDPRAGSGRPVDESGEGPTPLSSRVTA